MTVSPDEAALASIASTPLDDAPKLIYADWLQEHDEDAKAEYLRIVVRLKQAPEEPAAVARCLELAKSLDANWRQAVGGFFEVTIEGASRLMLYVLSSLIPGLMAEEHMGNWPQEDSLRLRRSLTREDAEAFVQKFGGQAVGRLSEGRLSLSIRPMTSEAPPQLLAPGAEPN